MAQAKLSDTKGTKVEFQVSARKIVTFTAGGKKRIDMGNGSVLVNGEIKTSEGRFNAILELDERSSGEYYGGYYFVKDANGEIEVKTINVGKHKYKYHAPIMCHDHHIGDDGWSL